MAVVMGVLGAIAVLSIVAAVAYWCCRRPAQGASSVDLYMYTITPFSHTHTSQSKTTQSLRRLPLPPARP